MNEVISFWNALEEKSIESTNSSCSWFSSSLESTSDSVSWSIENRGGLAKLVGIMMVPSQFIGPDKETSQKRISQVCQMRHQDGFMVKQINTKGLNGVICYPPGWKAEDKSRCVLYHNPNGATVAQFFENGRLSWTPGEVLKLKKCPIILYDYEGTGLNKNSTKPTYQTIQNDGRKFLAAALKDHDHVDVVGSSLGGGVATASLEQHLKETPKDAERVTLTNHDSFTTTARVVLPNSHSTADSLGTVVGGQLNAEAPMKDLIKRGVKVTVLCHKNDPVIPEGARMAEVVEKMAKQENVILVTSPHYGHANLSSDMIRKLS